MNNAQFPLSKNPDEQEPGYLFDITTSPAEMAEAVRRVRYFRLGHAQGIFYLSLFALAAIAMFIDALVKIIFPVPYVHASDAAGLGFYSLVIGIPTFVSIIRGLTTRSRPLLPANQNFLLFISAPEIQIHTKGTTTRHLWQEFTTLLKTPAVFIIMTRNSFLTVPTRAVPKDLALGFEHFTRGLCLKQGISHDFPVILHDTTAPTDSSLPSVPNIPAQPPTPPAH